MENKRILLASVLATRGTGVDKDALLTNCYSEEGVDGERIVKRPGVRMVQEIDGEEEKGQGAYYFVDGAVFVIDDELVTATATITGPKLTFNGLLPSLHHVLPEPGISGQPYQFATIPSNGTIPPKLFIKNTTAAYVYDGITVEKVVSANYPPLTVWGCAYLDGRVYVCAPDGSIFGSEIFDALTWLAATLIVAKSEGDQAVAMARHLVYIIIFKQFSTEFFYDAGLPAPGSPLAPMLNAFIEVGCAVGGSISLSDNTVFFMSESRPKGRSISRMDGFDSKPVSTMFIDRLLNADSLEDVFSYVVKKNGHVFYVLLLTSSQLTLVYDDTAKKWHHWTFSPYAKRNKGSFELLLVDLIQQEDMRTVVAIAFDPSTHGLKDGDPIDIAYTNLNGDPAFERVNITWLTPAMFSVILSQTIPNPAWGEVVVYEEKPFPWRFYTRGFDVDLLLAGEPIRNISPDTLSPDAPALVFFFEQDTYQDHGCPINVKARTSNVDWGVMKSKRMNTLELVGDIEDTTVLVRFNDQDYREEGWGIYRHITVTWNRAHVSAMGSTRRRAHEFRHTGDTSLRMESLEVTFNVGAR